MTFARLQQIYRRQDPPAWGASYQPGILATREEAPNISRAAQMWSQKLQRYVHALSATEQAAVRLALFHPQLFELQEQRMLPVTERQHPLVGHPRAVGMELSPLPGTVIVAERLDLLRVHGWIRHHDADVQETKLVPTPMFGDLLLFLADERGPYAVNWTIKHADEDFGRSVNLRSRVRNAVADASAARARHAIEEQLYLDGGIRTVRVVADTVPQKLDHNLRLLFLHQRPMRLLEHGIQRELEDRIRAGIGGEPPQAALLGVTHRHSCDYQDVRHAFFCMLWERRVKVELIDELILVDRPLNAERNPVLTRYSHLFSREV
ncbi:hypothetical protein [Pelomonas cellulosilytica]|uniref:Uncharacterized protein n=1 Tax=Pelomonas cellulosilytica TaxID=2906762 RepID=A0ABS8XN95_9BURK|nr:hypothetical protein [Pelomonas sp. P8]MCE4554239.1 hypothetical protein [Pelomonas sp. P8]